MQVECRILEKLAEADAAEVLPLLIADEEKEILRIQVGGLVAEIRISDDRHAVDGSLLASRLIYCDLNCHVADVGADGGILEAPGVFPGQVENLQLEFPGQFLCLRVP